jgi:hypothetical protein
MSTRRRRKDGWSEADDAMLCDLWRADVRMREIAARLGRTEGAAYSRANKLKLGERFKAPPVRRQHRHGNRPASGAIGRPCLRCGQPFPSEGSHHRLCRGCSIFAGQALDASFPIHGLRGLA